MRSLLRFRRGLILLSVLVVALMAVFPASAQSTPTPATPVNPNAFILFPPPVYVLRGQFPILGSADVPGMAGYFIEFRPVSTADVTGAALTATPVASPTPPIFFPAVLPSTRPVTNGLLGTWDTTLVPDGLYELRLTVTVTGATPITDTVGPVRVENALDPAVEQILTANGISLGGVGGGALEPTATQVVATAIPTATIIPTEDPTPRGTVITATANVRTGDSTNYPVIAVLPEGTVVLLIGISNQGSGWYQVQMPSGGIGWMSPSVLAVTGNTTLLPRVQPPPPPITPTFTPIPATATPITTTNLVAGNGYLTPNPPVCNQTFQVGIDIANLGGQANSVTGLFTVVDTHVATGTVTASTQGPVPIIQPGQTTRVDVPLTVSTFFNEAHRITITIDPSNQIPETNKSDNVRTIDYILQQGSC